MSRRSASSMFNPSSSYSYPPIPSPHTNSSTMPTRRSAATLSRKPPQPALKRPRPSSSGNGCSSSSDNGQTSVAKRQRRVLGGGESPVTVLDGASASSSPVPLSKEEIEKAARVATMKARFASTIVKARQHHLYGSTNTDLEKKIQTYRESVTQKADQLGVQVRSRERDAAYLKLLEVEKNVVVDDNFKTMKEFHMLLSGHKF